MANLNLSSLTKQSPSITSYSNPKANLIFPFLDTESTPIRTSDVDYRLLEASKAGDLETVKVNSAFTLTVGILPPGSFV